MENFKINGNINNKGTNTVFKEHYFRDDAFLPWAISKLDITKESVHLKKDSRNSKNKHNGSVGQLHVGRSLPVH